MTTSPNLLQKAEKFLISHSQKAREISGNTGDAPIPKLHDLQDFTSPTEGSDLAVFVSKSGDRYYVIDREDTSLFLLERTQQMKELREAPSEQWDAIQMASMQQMASLILFSRCFGIDKSLPKVDLSNQQIQNMMKIFKTMIETSDRDLKGPRPFIPPEQRQDFEQQVQRELQQLQTASEHHAEALAGYWSGELSADHLNAISNFMIETRGEPTPERLLWLMKTWHETPGLPDPLMPLIQAWQKEQNAKHINREYDLKHPVAIIEKSILGSIRDVVLDIKGDGNLPIITEQTPELQQLDIWESEDPLPSVLPWSRLLWDGISLQTKSGAVSHGVCVTDEVFMELNTGEWEGRQRWELGTLLRALHANLTEKQLTSNRKKYLTHVIKGIHEVQILGWKAQEDGKSGLYIPIKIPQRFMPTIESPDDFTVIFEIAIPTAGGAGYMMVEKDVIRRARKKSSNQLNAAKTSYWLIDTYGTGKTKEGIAYIIDPEKPDYYHDDDGYVIHPETDTRIRNQKGQPLKNPYHTDAVRQLPRDKNESQNRYRVLSLEQRIRAVYPDGYPSTMRKAAASKRADKAFDALAQRGYFRIEKLPDGWRIMPSDSHVRRYRAIRRAKDKSK